MAKSGIKSGLRSARKQHINTNNNNNNETTIASTIEAEVKQEPVNEEFKEFAETAMNELLGWYGYGSSAARDSGGGGGSGTEMARPTSYKSNSNSNSSSPDSALHANGCGWCGKTVDENNGLLSGQSSFCSELCFSQSRRANFKKNKTCDWCRHVRHTVSYVDFQEGSAQLQFCSDKCLNQYKMHIFCRETQAHLEFHPHLLPTGSSSNIIAGGSSSLITPDLWLRDCKTPPEDDMVDDDDDDGDGKMKEESRNISLITNEMRNVDKGELRQTRSSSVDKVPKLIPIITLAPTSSLLASPSSSSMKRSTIIKKTKNKRKRFSSATITSQSTPNTSTTSTCSTSSLNLDEEVAQDLRIRHNVTPPLRMVPNLQEILQNAANLNNSRQNFSNPTVLNNLTSSSEEAKKVPFQMAAPSDLRVPNNPPSQTNQNVPQQDSTKSNISMIPPVTVLVPYPIMIPVPLPIPIPLPISAFLRAYFGTKTSDAQDQQSKIAKVDQELTLQKTVEKIVESKLSVACKDGRTEASGSSALVVEEEEIVVDIVEDEPKSPRMLRRRKKMLETNSATMETKGNNSKVIKKKI